MFNENERMNENQNQEVVLSGEGYEDERDARRTTKRIDSERVGRPKAREARK